MRNDEQNHNNERLLSPKQAARLAGVSTRTLRRWENDNVITSIRTTIGNHRRYREQDILKAVGSQSQNSKQRGPSNDERSSRKDDHVNVLNKSQIHSRESQYKDKDRSVPHLQQRSEKDDVVEHRWTERHPDSNFTSWEKQKHLAQASLEIERIKLKKRALIEAEHEEKRKREELQKQAAKKRRESEWLTEIKQAGLRKARQLYAIPGSGYRIEEPPPSVVSAIAHDLDEHITLSTCPFPLSQSNTLTKADAIRAAENCAQRLINEWIEQERAKNKEKEDAPRFPFSVLSDGEDDEESSDYDDQDDIEGDYWEDDEADDDDDWEDENDW